MRYPAGDRRINSLDDLKVMTSSGAVPISNFVSRSAVPNVDTIQRIDGIPVEFIRADIAPGVLADNKVQEIRAWPIRFRKGMRGGRAPARGCSGCDPYIPIPYTIAL